MRNQWEPLPDPIHDDTIGFAFKCGAAFGVILTAALFGLCYLIQHSA